MIKELVHDPIFLGQKSETATIMDLQTAKDLLDTLTAHKDTCVGMAANMIAAGAGSLKEALKLFWTIRVPWHWAYSAGFVPDWIAQFSFGFYSLMLTSTLIGLIVMALYKPRTWCTFCPMGTMTQTICKLKHRKEK